jgi:uncharacterized membrane protein HdeD (DUF308 family)
MSTSPQTSLQAHFAAGHETLRRVWGWLLLFGIILILMGIFAFAEPWFFSTAYVLWLGCLLIIAGILSILQALQTRAWGGFFLALFTAILDLVIGVLMVTYPGDATVIMTLLLAAFFLVGGFFRIFFALAARFPGWGWSVLSGIIAVILGAMIWNRWPWSSVWVIGVFLGVELFFRGWALIMLALTARSATTPMSHVKTL